MSRSVAMFAALAAVAGCCPVPPRAPATARPAPAPVAVAATDAPAPAPLDWSAAGIDWSKPPPAWDQAPFVPPAPVHFTMANGLEVYLVENHRLPLVSIRMIHRAAGSRADGARAGLAALTADLLDEGAGARSAQELPRELERLGASMSISAGSDAVFLSVDTLAETLAPTLDVVADVLLRPRFAAADFRRVRAERVADLELRVDSPRSLAALAIDRVVFGDHPYARPGSGWVDTVSRLTRSDVERFWKQRYGPRAASLVVAGAVTRAELEPLLKRRFGRWRTRVKTPRPPRPPSAAAPVLAVIDLPGRPQTVVTIGRLGPPAADPDRAALDIANTALGGSFASRLNTRLREQLGYTYGIGARFYRGEWTGAWTVGSSIRTDVTGPAIREALAIIRATSSEPLPADELAKTKALIIRGLPQSFETNAAMAGAFASLIADRRPLTAWRDRAAAIDEVTADRALTAAARAWADVSIVVVGDWKVIGNDLEQLGLPVVRYDVEGRPRP